MLEPSTVTSLLYCTFQVTVFYFLSIYFSHNFFLLLPSFWHKYQYFLLLTFSKQAGSIWGELSSTFIFGFSHAAFPNITRLILTCCRRSKMEKGREGKWGQKVCQCLVSADTREPSAWLFFFSQFVAVLGALYQHKMSVTDVLGIGLNNKLSLWCVYEQLGQILLILPLNYINMTWISISFAPKRPVEMLSSDTFILWEHFRAVVSQFDLSQEVESALLLLLHIVSVFQLE